MSKPHKVLMTLMGMEIGGAETHVLELSKTLRQMGLEVHVVSNGGVYVSELEACGIKHYSVPLHNKQFINVFSSYRAIHKIIVDNDIQLVHAHARIPAFICGLLQKRLKFKLVTSAHLDFNVQFPYNVLSNWGDRVLAVSSDIKDYLIANYNIDEHLIDLTVNAIDTDKFSPSIPTEDIYNELGLRIHTCKIVCVSRMDADRYLPAKILIQIAEKLVQNSPQEFEIILVGDGNQMQQIEQNAERVNAKLGHKLIHVTGARMDINKFMALADIFVNVSRSALEAMAAATPTILAGNQGYLGIMCEEIKQAAVDTNFTCRNCGDTTAAKLYADLMHLLSQTEEENAALGSYLRELMLREYSLSRMAQDAIDMYNKVFAAKPPVNIVVSGYYGYNNSGDDIMLKSIIQNLRAARKNLSISVLSLNPKETRARFNVRAVHRFNFLAVLLRLRKARLLISGGGNLMQDETSTQSLLYYLWIINTARALGVKNMLYANGIGPVRKSRNKKRVRKALNRVDLITLRENASLKALRDMGVTKPEMHVTADAAFALLEPKRNTPPVVEGKYFCVAIRPWPTNPQNLEAEIASFADYLVQTQGYKAVFVPMRPEQDADIAKRIIACMAEDAVLIQPRDYTVARQVLGQASFALCMRLHALIYAAECGVPAIGLVYGPKVQGFMESLNQSWHMKVEDTSAEKLKLCSDAMHADMDKISADISAAGAKLRELAMHNTKLCIQLLDR